MTDTELHAELNEIRSRITTVEAILAGLAKVLNRIDQRGHRSDVEGDSDCEMATIAQNWESSCEPPETTAAEPSPGSQAAVARSWKTYKGIPEAERKPVPAEAAC